ncbi:MAG: hypothetical protein K6T28_09055 [Acidothermus sp.]|nr:hypothetical protein [Acidothermus sp.]
MRNAVEMASLLLADPTDVPAVESSADPAAARQASCADIGSQAGTVSADDGASASGTIPKRKRSSRRPRSSRRGMAELRGPASLVSPEARRLARCRYCGGPHVTSIELTLTDGSAVSFGSCHRCERHWWAQDGELLSFDLVLAKTSKIA